MCHLLCVLILFLHMIPAFSDSNPSSKHTYVALVDPLAKPSPFLSHHYWYTSLLSSTSTSPTSYIHIYNTLIHGFSASLTSHQAQQLQGFHGFLSLFSDSLFHLHTTRSPSFLGLNNLHSPELVNTTESNTIIGFIDTGISPQHPSFSDLGLEPVPKHWKGECETGFGFNRTHCNRKLIGARFFSAGYQAFSGQPGRSIADILSPIDSDGHGTHVASIAAGAPVPSSGFFGFADGLARGMAPKARVSVYKVCWISGCLLSDICAAIDKAVSDGVDILSISLGSSRLPFYLDLLSIVSFRAFARGVFIAASAGNEGPSPASVANEPPWITTIGSGTMDRNFPATVRLGNGISVVSGTSITLSPRPHKLTRNFHSLILGGKVYSTTTNFNFSHQLVEGKIVLLITNGHVARLQLGASLKYLGALAMIISHGDIDPDGIVSEPHLIPTITVSGSQAKLIENYILHNQNPTAMISSQGTIPMHAKPAPVVASFSSRGPNSIVPEILKPDIIAPGVNILGAWTPLIGPSGMGTDTRRPRFNIMSGTSMACPHVSGVAALIKSNHPNLSPSEIKSALMTTSTIRKIYCDTNETLLSSPLISNEYPSNIATPFDIGVGHIQPKRAIDPGLVFDSDYKDYVDFLCGLNYTTKQIQIVAGKDASCSKFGVGQLNYPAIVVEAERVENGEVILSRRLKNVNEGPREYKPYVMGPSGHFEVDIKPKRLKFFGIGERLSFRVIISKRKEGLKRKKLWFGALTWREKGGKHRVRCPILIFSASKYRDLYQE